MPSKSTSNDLVPPVGTEGQSGSTDNARSSTAFPLKQGMSVSLWLETVRNDPLLDHRTTSDLPITADVVIIGSGISGSLAALTLLQSSTPPKSLIMLEARELCSGATGRNAGHCKPDMWRGYSKYAEEFGSKQALKILDNEMQTWKAVNKYIADNKVDCDLWTGRTLDVMMTNCTARAAKENYDAFVKAGGNTWGIDVEEDPARAEQLSRIMGAKAVYQTHASTLHPWKLAAHVIETSLGLGLNLQTWTPVRSVTAGKGGKWSVNTDRGTVTTPTVIHTTNAYAGALLPEVIGPINPVPHMCNKVQAPSSFSGSKAIQHSYAVIYPKGAYTINPRQGGGGELLFGGSAINQQKLLDYVADEPESRRTDDSLVDFEPITEAVRLLGTNGFKWDYKPGDKGAPARYERAWSGIIGRSLDEVPFVGEVPGKPGQWISAGHNGHGMPRRPQAAQKGLDRFPNCYASTAFPKAHGPLTRSEVDAKNAKEAEELKAVNAKLDAQFPWLQQLFIGPRTKQQARNDKLLRELMREGDFEDVTVLLPSENLRFLMEGGAKKGHGHGHPPKADKKSYEQARMEKEKAKVAEALAAAGIEPKKVPSQPRIGPMTKEEWMATLPVYGPKTLQEYLLPVQREQRHVILSWLRKPWPVFDADAAELMEKLGRLALKKLDAEAREAKGKAGETKDAKSKVDGTKEAKEVKGGKDGKDGKEGRDGEQPKEVKEEKKGKDVKEDKKVKA